MGRSAMMVNRTLHCAILALTLPFLLALTSFVPLAMSENDVPLSPHDRIRAASRAAWKPLRSAKASGVYLEFAGQDDSHLQLKTKARVAFCFSGQKQRLEVNYEKMTGQYHNENVIVLSDEKRAHLVRFSQGLDPTGCAIDVFADQKSACKHIEFSFEDPICLQRCMLNVDKVMKDEGEESFKVAKQPWGFRATWHPRSAPDITVEFDTHTRLDDNIAVTRVFNPGDSEPVNTRRAVWQKTTEGLWYVQSLIEDTDTSRVHEGSEEYRRTILRLDKFQPNVVVAPRLFALEELDIPSDIGTFDHRQKSR